MALSKKDLELITATVAALMAAQANPTGPTAIDPAQVVPNKVRDDRPKFESNWNDAVRTETGWISLRKDAKAAVETVHTSDGKVFYACLPDGEDWYRQGRPYNTRRAARKAASQMVRHGRKAA